MLRIRGRDSGHAQVRPLNCELNADCMHVSAQEDDVPCTVNMMQVRIAASSLTIQTEPDAYSKSQRDPDFPVQ